ncbi:MAG: phosphatase PAP2 family protein [Acidimicrobiales bacterium]
MTGWSRLQGGQHFPTDVAAGAAFGAAVGVATHQVARRLEAKRPSPAHAACDLKDGDTGMTLPDVDHLG